MTTYTETRWYTRPVVKDSAQATAGHQDSSDTNLTGGTWRTIFAEGDGIIGATSAAAAMLTLSGDTATVAAFTARFDGFIIVVPAAVSFTIPATAGTYVVGVLSTPANDARADLGGPLSLAWFAQGSQPSSGWLPLWSFTRSTAAMNGSTPIADLRPYAGESSFYPGLSATGLPGSAALGEEAILGDGRRYVRVPSGASSAQWVESPGQPWARFNALTSPDTLVTPTLRTNWAVRWSVSPAASRAVSGVAWSSNGILVPIPAAGLWTVQATINLTALQTGPRAYVQIKNNGDDTYFSRNTFAGDDYGSTTYANWLTSSSSVKVEVYLSNTAKIAAGSYITLTRTSA